MIVLEKSLGRLLLLCVLLAGEICIHAEQNETTNGRDGVLGAIPDEKLVYKKAIACEGQKLFISCENIYDKIQIQESFYGREDINICKHPTLPSDKKCTEQNKTVNNIVKDLCYAESQCEVSVTNDFLAQSGTIICPNVYKYLFVKYRCVPKSALPDVPMGPTDPDAKATRGIPIRGSSSLTPVQCCYVVPGGSATHQTTFDTVGGTIIRHNAGTQSVEERIVSEKTQAPQMSKVTEIIHGPYAQQPSSTNYPVNIPTPVRTPNLRLSTLLHTQTKRLGLTNLISIDSSQLGNAIAKPSKRNVVPKPPRAGRYKQWLQKTTAKRRKKTYFSRVYKVINPLAFDRQYPYNIITHS